MGTHPIFESDFDCLTEIYSAENMKVLKQSALGDSSTLYIGEEEVPEIENNELLVKIEYSALNRADIMMREGRYPNQKLPRPIGLEGAGRVTKIVASLEEGSTVFVHAAASGVGTSAIQLIKSISN